MVKQIEIPKTRVEKEPYLVWNSFVQLIAMSKPDELNETQSVAHLAFEYDSEVQNGGHLQYFENEHILYKEKLPALVSATLEALKIIGADKQAKILSQAYNKYLSQVRKNPITPENFSELELEDTFGKLDDKYYELSPDMNHYLEKLLHVHIDQFIKFI